MSGPKMSEYAQRMARLSAKIFGEVPHHQKEIYPGSQLFVGPTDPKPVRVMAEKPIKYKPEVVDYYPRHIETTKILTLLRKEGLFTDEAQDFKDEMNRQREMRGKFNKVKAMRREMFLAKLKELEIDPESLPKDTY